ncbi:hypothetical protein K439DRAFT_876840 [Ramaria rubella]|nr:hypothetical protein K439DRAFT_876840 [Ramaria rubella]
MGDSYIMDEFWKDPARFMNPQSQPSRAISSHAIELTDKGQPIAFTNEGYAGLELQWKDPVTDQRTYQIKYRGENPRYGEDTKRSYFLGFNSGSKQSPRPACVDILKKAPDGMFLFTGSLTGCSVVVTDPGGDKFRVFHDSRENSSIIHDNVVMAIDWKDYSITDGRYASVFMQYRKGWKLFCQLQEEKASKRPGPSILVQRKTAEPGSGLPRVDSVIVKEPGSFDATIERNAFFERRERSGKDLTNLAREVLKIDPKDIPNEPDGKFKPFDGGRVNLENDAVKHSQKIRKKVESTYDNIRTKYINSSVGAISKDEYGALSKLVEPTLGISENLDFTYLWLLEKKEMGIDAVVVTDKKKQATSLGDTVGERFVGQELDLLFASDPDFVSGYNAYQEIKIPGFASDMSSLEMMTLFDMSSQLTQTQKGALVHHIRIVGKREWQDSVWNQTDKVVKMFQKAGGSTKPMPQDLLLEAVPDEYGGRCYPLVRAMAVALSQSSFAVDQLGIKLITLTSETDLANARVFRNCLRDLHASYPAAEASTLIGRSNLKDAIDRLQVAKGERKIFALNTESHAMLLGATNDGNTTSYHFYDPNFTVATFSSQKDLLAATTQFLIELGYADVYGASGTPQDPVFTLVDIDTEKMARIGFDYGLNVEDFSQAETLVETIDIMGASELHLPAPDRFTENSALSSGANLLEAAGLAEAWHQATVQLEESTGLGRKWMPILATLEKEAQGYRIQFVNLEDPSEQRWLSTEDPKIKEFKTFLDERLEAVRKAYEFEGGTFIERESVSSAEAIDGLSAMFLVKTLIENFNGRQGIDDKDTSSNLAIALKVHSYLNLTQLGQQSLGDIIKIAQLTQTIIRSEEAAQSSLTTVARAFGRVSEGTGVVLGAANVVFDAYELGNAQTEIQKAVFGTQLVFDSASFLASVGSVGAGMVGASSAAAVLGGITVVLAGLAVGFGALAVANGQAAQDAQAVGRYFGDADKAYSQPYTYDQKNKILVPLAGAVIKRIDIIDMNGIVEFDSQYIYRTHHGSSGSGNINYFAWAGDFPTEVRDRTQAINVRIGIGAGTGGILPNFDPLTTLILPATPKSYIGYSYGTLFFATTRHDYGFDVIRRLEVDGRFDYDFYIFPFETIIRNITHEYVDTPVTIQLDDSPIRLQIPTLPSAMQGHLHYTLEGYGSDYTIGMQGGVGLTLSTKSAPSNSTRWILDCRQLTNDSATVDSNGLGVKVAGIHVALSDRNFTSMIIITRMAEVMAADFDNHRFVRVEEDGSKYPGGSDNLLAHLDDLNQKHLLYGSFIMIDNYTPSGTDVGRAFYDVTRKRVLYTAGAPQSLTVTVQLGAVTPEDEVYFYNTENDALWRVDPSTGVCLAVYLALYPSSERTLMRVWEEDNQVLAVYRYTLSSDKDKHGELTYALAPDSMTLVNVVGDNDLLTKLGTMDRFSGSPEDLLKSYKSNQTPSTSPTDNLPGKKIKAQLDPYILSIYGEDNNDNPHRYWLRLTDGTVVKPNFKPPPDIVFAGTITAPVGGKEEFCFYSLSTQEIHLQTGTGTSTSKPRSVNIPGQFGKLSNVFCVNNELFAITDAGYIFRITTAGTLFLEGVNNLWFKRFGPGSKELPWWNFLKDTAESVGATIVAILGLIDSNEAVIPAWYYNGKIVIAAEFLHGKQIQLAGLVKGGHEAWLCQWDAQEHAHLYRQPLVPDVGLSQIFKFNVPEVHSDNIPTAIKVLENYSFQNIIMTANGLQCTTTDGIILILSDKDSITLYGVDKSWQKKHFSTLEASLAELTQQWAHGEVVVLQGLIPTVTPSWYIVSAAKIVAVSLTAKITWADNPVWLGLDVNGTEGYFYLQAQGQICSINLSGDTKRVATLTMARRFDQLLVLGLPETQFSLPAISNVRYAMASHSQGSGSVDYRILQTNWDYYEANVLQVQDKSSSNNTITMFLKVANPGKLLAKKIGDDLVIVDVTTGHSATIRKAFAAGQTYKNIGVRTSLGDTLSLKNIQDAQEWLKAKAKLDILPDVTLATVDYYMRNPNS